MIRLFGFVKEWELMIYGKMCQYFQFVLKELKIPFEVFDTVAKLRESTNKELLVFLPFDAMCQRCEKEIPQIPNVNYILLITEPEHNIESNESMKYCLPYMSSIYATLNLNMNQNDVMARLFPTQIHFNCFQGYFPQEDLKSSASESEKKVDVVAPGFEGSSEYRKNIVKQLRGKGLTVADGFMTGAEFDLNVRRAKIVIAVPFNERYNMWYGQRTLWPLNKQACVVTIPSMDSLAEEFYSGLFIYTSYEDMANTVANVIASGFWKTFAQQAYERFQKDYHCLDVLDEDFYQFCCDWTNTPIKIETSHES